MCRNLIVKNVCGREGAFIFDMDGTIVDNMGAHTRVWIDFLAGFGIHLPVEEFHRQASGKTTRQILQQMIGDHITESEIKEYSERKESLYRAIYRPRLKPVRGLENFLRRSKQLGIAMALATSADRTNIDFILDGTGLTFYFKSIVGAEDIVHGKPDPEMFQIAAGRLKVPAGKCVVFEDSLVGMEAARRAGMKAVAITTTLDAQDFQEMPAVIEVVEDYVQLDPEALMQLV